MPVTVMYAVSETKQLSFGRRGITISQDRWIWLWFPIWRTITSSHTFWFHNFSLSVKREFQWKTFRWKTTALFYFINNFISQVHETLMGWVKGITGFVNNLKISHFNKISGRAFSLVFSDQSRPRTSRHHPIPAWEKIFLGKSKKKENLRIIEKPSPSSTCHWQICCRFN